LWIGCKGEIDELVIGVGRLGVSVAFTFYLIWIYTLVVFSEVL
jgi:hypothetical protein